MQTYNNRLHGLSVDRLSVNGLRLAIRLAINRLGLTSILRLPGVLGLTSVGLGLSGGVTLLSRLHC